jgi:hypothetical protein
MIPVKTGTRNRYLLVIMVGIILFMMQACMTTTYNNSNWRRQPPSTGHNRCGCLMQKTYKITPVQYGNSWRA